MASNPGEADSFTSQLAFGSTASRLGSFYGIGIEGLLRNAGPLQREVFRNGSVMPVIRAKWPLVLGPHVVATISQSAPID